LEAKRTRFDLRRLRTKMC